MAGSLPFFPFFWADWLLDTRDMTPAERGLYIDLLCWLWKEGPLPEDAATIQRILHCSAKAFAATWPAIRSKLTEVEPGRITSRRLEEERQKAIEKSIKASKAAKERHQHDANAERMQSERTAPGLRSEKDLEKEKKDRDPPTPLELVPAAPAPSKSSDAWKLRKHFEQRWVEVRMPGDGKPPEIAKEDAIAAAQLVKRYGLLEATRLVDQFLVDTDKFITGRGHLLRDIRQRTNAYRAQAKPTEHAPSQAEFHGHPWEITK